MNTKSEIPTTEDRPNVAEGIVARVDTIAIFIVLQAVILFLAAGRLTWAWAWVYLGICLVSVAINGTIMIGGWAMITNAYFSTAVRIQSDRDQTVCRSGPYRFVRHPGYVGFILQSLGTPILLGSWWALVPGLMAAVLMVIRTTFEDRMLQAELPGYREYTQQVHYRLVPGVW